MTTKEAASYLGISVYYLRNMRHLLHNHDGPRFTKTKHPRGWACIYAKNDLDIWFKQHKFRKGHV